jgi:hypothetical protein
MMNDKIPYEDIINLPRPVSKKHPQPPLSERAARFAPFAAITGYEEMVLEEARVTEEKIELDESALTILNEKLNILQNSLSQSTEITVTYFVPDKKKNGGAYRTVTGIVKRIDPYQKILILQNDEKIQIEKIYDLKSDLFYTLDN